MNRPSKTIFYILTAIIITGLSGIITAPTARAGDIEGSKDHPVITRLPGSEITRYRHLSFDRYMIPLGKQIFVKKSSGRKLVLEEKKKVEGALTMIRYLAPEDASPLGVFRSYEEALKNAGFEMLFTCTEKECGPSFKSAVYDKYARGGLDYELIGAEERFLSAYLKRPRDGDVYVSLFVTRHKDIVTKYTRRVLTQLDIVEVKPLKKNLIRVDAEAMAEGLEKKGHIALYNVYFDSNRATLKPRSAKAIGEIAELLQEREKLKLLVVGHTDNKGTLEHNMKLSKERAEAVVDKLVTKHGISTDRLAAEGVAFLSPVAPNRTTEGREKNRRVELVEQ